MRKESYEMLEEEFALWQGLKPDHMVACSSGTAALHLALEAMGIAEPGGTFAVPDYTMVACPRAVTMAGLTPVLVSPRADLTVDARDVVTKGPHLDGVMAVHVYGRRCDVETLANVCGDWNIPLVEDLAEAHGVRPHPETDAACWSFYKNKIVAGEEGGAVYFADRTDANRARCLRSLGFTAAHDYSHFPRGHNYRMANCLADRVRESLRNYTANLTYRRMLECVYDRLCPPEWKMPPRDAPWVYDVRIPGLYPPTRYRIVEALQARGIAARHGFRPVSEQEEYSGCTRRVNGWEETNPGYWQEVIYLPLTPGTPERSVADAFDVMRGIVQEV